MGRYPALSYSRQPPKRHPMDDAQRIPEPLHSNVIGNTTRYEEAPTNTGLPRDSRLLRLSDRLHVAVSLVAVGPFASFSDISTDDYHDSGVHRVGYWFLHVGPPRRQRTDPATQHRRRLVWAADGTRFAGYRLDKYTLDGVLIHPIYSNSARIWAEGCSLEVRFGTRGGERRAYVTADYGHDNPGTVVDIEVAGGTLSVTRTGVFPPGSPTLSGVVFEVTPTGQLPSRRSRRSHWHFIRIPRGDDRSGRVVQNSWTG
jgi:hypothetical protein